MQMKNIIYETACVIVEPKNNKLVFHLYSKCLYNNLFGLIILTFLFCFTDYE